MRDPYRYCASCKFEDADMYAAPCLGCFGVKGKPNWVSTEVPAPIPEVRDAADGGYTTAPLPDLKPSKPRVLILGHGRHGKDTVAELLRDDFGFTFASSSFFAAEMAVRPALAAVGVTYDTLEECYEDRVNYRGFWYEAIAAYNRGGTSKLAQAILVDHDIYVGMRSNREYQASKDLFDIVVWVDAFDRGLPAEPASSFDIEYDPKEMYRINNGSSLENLREQVAQFALLVTWGR